MSNKIKKVIIIGAGPAGLAAGYRLKELGAVPIILEKENRVGGKSKTIEHQKYFFDLGPHRFFTKSKIVVSLWQKILKKDLLEVQRQTRILFAGKYLDYPLKPINALFGLGFSKAFVFTVDFIFTKIKNVFVKKPEKTFEDWATNRFGNALYRQYFKGYTEKVWGINCDKISASWGNQRIKGMSFTAVLKQAFLPSKKRPKSLIDKFFYPKNGAGQFYEKLAQEIGKNFIKLNEPIIGIEHKNNKIISVSTESKKYTGDAFIFTLPLSPALNKLKPFPPKEIVSANNRLLYRSMVCVHLTINRKRVFPDQWLYIQDQGTLIGRICEPKNFSLKLVPNPNKTSLTAELWCFKNDILWQKSDQEIINLAIEELVDKLKLIKKEEVEYGFVSRIPYAYPVYQIGYEKNLKIVTQYFSRFKNLIFAGREATYQYNNMDHSILQGLFAAENLFGAKHNLNQVNPDEEYLEEEKK